MVKNARPKTLSRRTLVRLGMAALGTGAVLPALVACSTPAPTATAVPAKPAAPAPAAPAPAAKPTTAPAPAPAAKPTAAAAAKPAPAAAAKPTTAPAPAAAAPKVAAGTKLQFMGSEGRAPQQAIQKQVEKFVQQSKIQVEYTTSPSGEFYTKLQTMIAGNVAPDMHWMDFRNLPRYAHEGHLLHLDPLVQRDKYDIEDVHDKYLSQCFWDGKQFANARDFGWRQIYYNVDLFEKAGVPLPPGSWDAAGWTYDDFAAAAEKLTKRDGSGRVEVWGFANATDYFAWIYANGGRMIDEQNERAMVYEKEAVRGLEFLQELMHKRKVSQTPEAAQELNPQQTFMAGRAAMIINPTATGTTTYRTIKNFKWDTAPVPKGWDIQGDRRNHGGGSSWVLAKSGKNQDAAWELSKFISGKDTQTELAKVGFAPSRRSVITSEVWLDPQKPPKSKEVMAKGGDHIIPNPKILTWGEFEKETRRILENVWLGKNTVQEIVPDLKTMADGLMAKHKELLKK